MIFQEALTNVYRHAGATECRIAIQLNDKLELDVIDNGRGIGPARHSGAGLTSMRQRAEELGGSFEIASYLQGGTRVSARLPISLAKE